MGYDVGLTARYNGGTVQGGVNAQRRAYDTCSAPILSGATINQVDSPEAVFCHQVTPFRPDFKLLATRTLPWGMMISGTYQVSSGPMITATWAAPNSLIAPALGRNQSACPATGTCTATKSLQLISPGSLYGRYQNQLDMRLSKHVRIGRYQFRADANLYNVLNSDYANSINTTFSTTASSQYLRPTAVLLSRMFKVGGQIEF